MRFDIVFLGTGDAVPSEKRNHTGILVSFGEENILVDCGENIQRQFRFAHLNPGKLTRILLTHLHGDHTFGLPGLFQTLAMRDYNKKLGIYGPHGVKEYISVLERYFLQYRINLDVHEVNGKFVDKGDFYLESLGMAHGTPANAYAIVIKDKVRLDKKKLKKFKLPNSPLIGQLKAGKDITFNGRKIRAKDICYFEKGKKIVVILDTGMNENAVKIAHGADLLICESTFLSKDAEKAAERNHLTAAQAATIAKKAHVKRLILTHISQRYEDNFAPILKEAKKIFKNVNLARDFEKAVA